jgi:hypothetical protein
MLDITGYSAFVPPAMRVSLEAFSELLEALYSVPLQHEGWEHFLPLLSGHTGSEFGVLLCASSLSALSI